MTQINFINQNGTKKQKINKNKKLIKIKYMNKNYSK